VIWGDSDGIADVEYGRAYAAAVNGASLWSWRRPDICLNSKRRIGFSLMYLILLRGTLLDSATVGRLGNKLDGLLNESFAVQTDNRIESSPQCLRSPAIGRIFKARFMHWPPDMS
jgi:hypothetical protein